MASNSAELLTTGPLPSLTAGVSCCSPMAWVLSGQYLCFGGGWGWVLLFSSLSDTRMLPSFPPPLVIPPNPAIPCRVCEWWRFVFIYLSLGFVGVVSHWLCCNCCPQVTILPPEPPSFISVVGFLIQRVIQIRDGKELAPGLAAYEQWIWGLSSSLADSERFLFTLFKTVSLT